MKDFAVRYRWGETTQRLLANDLFGESFGESNPKENEPFILTVRKFASRRLTVCNSASKCVRVDDFPVGELLSFWAIEGLSLHTDMAHMARVLSSVSAPSTVLERGIRTAEHLVTGCWSSLTATYTEMVLFLERRPRLHSSRRARHVS